MPRTKEFNPDEALEQVMAQFWTCGYAATSVQDLVEATGLSRSSLYDTFGGKQALYLAALDQYRRQGTQALCAELEAGGSPLEAVRRVFEQVACDCAAGTRGCFVANATVERAARDPETGRRAAESLRNMQAAFARAVRRAQEADEVPAGRDAEALGHFLTNAYYGLRTTARVGLDRSALEDIIRTTLAALT